MLNSYLFMNAQVYSSEFISKHTPHTSEITQIKLKEKCNRAIELPSAGKRRRMCNTAIQ